MTVPEVSALLAGITGLVGTIGGILIPYATLRHQQNKDRPRIKVSMGESLLINVPGTKPKTTYLTVTVANTGEQSFTVSNFGVALGKRSGGIVIPIPLGTVQLPYTLAKDQTCTFWTEYNDSISQLKQLENRRRKRMKIRASIGDYAGRTFYSDWHTVDFEKSRLWGSKDKIMSSIRRVRIWLLP